MYRYTLGKKHDLDDNLFQLIRDGVKTRAWASKKALLSEAVFISGGEFHDGEFHDGVFFGGEFHDGVFHDGWFYGGVFYGGKYFGGVFFGGVFHDGEFHDGVFHDGEFRDGWLPLQIQGSRHFVNIPDGQNIKIGCIKKSPAWWEENYAQAGRKERYTNQQIKEYKMYIDVAATQIECAGGD